MWVLYDPIRSMARCHQHSPPPNHIPPLILMAYSQGPLGDVGVGGVSEGRKIKLIWLSNFFRLRALEVEDGVGVGRQIGGDGHPCDSRCHDNAGKNTHIKHQHIALFCLCLSYQPHISNMHCNWLSCGDRLTLTMFWIHPLVILWYGCQDNWLIQLSHLIIATRAYQCKVCHASFCGVVLVLVQVLVLVLVHLSSRVNSLWNPSSNLPASLCTVISAQRVGFFNIGSGPVLKKYRVAGRVRVPVGHWPFIFSLYYPSILLQELPCSVVCVLRYFPHLTRSSIYLMCECVRRHPVRCNWSGAVLL